MTNGSGTSIRPPYDRPADNRRPYGSHRFDVYSAKLRRRVTLFGVRALEHWIALEADATVKQFCERPLVVRDVRPGRVVDFWASGSGFSKFVFLIRDGEAKAAEKRLKAYAGFRAWAIDAGCSIEEVQREEATAARARWLRNWTQMLQQVASYQAYLPSDLLQRLDAAISTRQTIRSALDAATCADPEIGRAAIYLLVHRGTHRIADLESAILSDDFMVEPA